MARVGRWRYPGGFSAGLLVMRAAVPRDRGYPAAAIARRDMSESQAGSLVDVIEEKAKTDPGYPIAYALYA
jgi:hypothetical protein